MLSLRAPPGCRRESPCTSGSIQLGALAHGAERSSQRSLWHGQTLTVLTPTQPLHWPQSSTSDFSMPGDLWPTGPCPGRRRRQRTSVRHVRRSGVVGESLLPGRSAPRVRTSTDGVEGIIRACIPLDKRVAGILRDADSLRQFFIAAAVVWNPGCWASHTSTSAWRPHGS